jgi:hypothetical protein
MMRAFGCLVLVLLAAAAGWFLRDRIDFRDGDVATAGDTVVVWEPITPEGADRARKAIEDLGARSAPVFASLRPGDVSSYIFVALARQLPPSAERIESAVIGDRLHVRASVKLSDFGGPGALGPLAGFLGERETMELGGYFHVIRPGLAEFRVTDLRLGTFNVPTNLIPRLIRGFSKGARPDGVADDGLPLVVPPYLADVRIAGGRVVLYRNPQ